MESVLIIVALIVSFLVFTFLIKVVKSAIGTAITIAIIVLAMQIIFGIGPRELWQEIVNLWAGVLQNFNR